MRTGTLIALAAAAAGAAVAATRGSSRGAQPTGAGGDEGPSNVGRARSTRTGVQADQGDRAVAARPVPQRVAADDDATPEDLAGNTAGRVGDTTDAAGRSADERMTDADALVDTVHGRDADAPTEIPKEGWKAILLRTKAQIKNDQMGLLAGGVTYYAMLALFPALVAAISIYGLVVDPAQLQEQIATLAENLPESAASLIQTQLESIVNSSSTGLSVALAVSLAGALWSASSGMKGLMGAITAAYDEAETRKFLPLRLRAIVLTLAAIVVLGVALGLVAVVPPLLRSLGLGVVGRIGGNVLSYALLALLLAGSLAVLYRFAPDRDGARLQWTSVGALVAVVLFVVASIGFSFYVNSFGKYEATYGALGGVIVLLLWLYITSFIVLLGAELNAEMEHQTLRDTTSGEAAAMGERDAYVSDTVPSSDTR